MAQPLTIEVGTVLTGYRHICEMVRAHGDVVAPRGQKVREVRGATIFVEDVTRDTIPVGIGRDCNVAIGAVEALNLVAGVSTPQLLAKVAPVFERFMDGEVLAGAYGPRIRWQVPSVVERLSDDGDSRQAIVQIWDPASDAFGVTKDMPCTLGFQFFIRHGELEMHTMMRSNDVWLGLAYDIAMFSALHGTIAAALGVDQGPITHRVGSLHLYERDAEKVDALEDVGAVADVIPPLGLDYEAVHVAQGVARRILAGKHNPSTRTELWYAETIKEWVPNPYLQTQG